MVQALARPAVRAAYRAQQASFRYALAPTQWLLRTLTAENLRPPARTVRALEQAYEELLERDVAQAEAGLYPAQLLFQMPLRDYARRLPRLLLEIPRAYARSRRHAYRELPRDVDPREFPAYFRRTFHWQTDGYLSARSADLYDVSVEFLFVGCADVMRRQVIPPMARFWRRARRRRLRILDVACGTGRTLRQIATALPGQRYFGVDLSPYYLAAARRNLSHVGEATLAAENAEELPFRDGCFDIVTSTYLFHELPRPTRRTALREMERVLRPGGLLVIEDSAQLAEADDLAFFLDKFAEELHEPFYSDYVRDDLATLVASQGFANPRTERAWLAKVVSAQKPPSPSGAASDARSGRRG